MNKKKLYSILAIVLVVVLAAFGFLYTRPVDVYALGSSFEPEIISISLTRSTDASTVDPSGERFAYFEEGDPGYTEALETVNSLRFRRPLSNVIPALAGSKSAGDPADCEYNMYLHLGQKGQDWSVYLSCLNGQWDYWDTDRKVSLPLTGDGTAADAKALGDLWWSIATPLDSYDIENIE